MQGATWKDPDWAPDVDRSQTFPPASLSWAMEFEVDQQRAESDVAPTLDWAMGKFLSARVRLAGVMTWNHPPTHVPPGPSNQSLTGSNGDRCDEEASRECLPCLRRQILGAPIINHYRQALPPTLPHKNRVGPPARFQPDTPHATPLPPTPLPSNPTIITPNKIPTRPLPLLSPPRHPT